MLLHWIEMAVFFSSSSSFAVRSICLREKLSMGSPMTEIRTVSFKEWNFYHRRSGKIRSCKRPGRNTQLLQGHYSVFHRYRPPCWRRFPQPIPGPIPAYAGWQPWRPKLLMTILVLQWSPLLYISYQIMMLFFQTNNLSWTVEQNVVSTHFWSLMISFTFPREVLMQLI